MFLVSVVRAVYFSGHDPTDFITKHEVTGKPQATEYEDHSNIFFSVPGMHHFCSLQHFVFKYLQPLSLLETQRGDSVNIKSKDRIIYFNLFGNRQQILCEITFSEEAEC